MSLRLSRSIWGVARALGPAVLWCLLAPGSGCSGSSGSGDLAAPRDAAMPIVHRDFSVRSDGAATGSDSGAPDAAGPSHDGGTDGPISTPDLATIPDLAASPATGTVLDTYVQAATTTMVPRNISGATIAALVPDGMGGFVNHPGTGLANGTYSIPGVPQGAYYLRFNNTYIVTGLRGVNLGATFLGRPGAVAASVKPTPLALNVASLNPWQPTDILQLFCPAVDSYISNVDSFAAAIAGASTSLNLTVDYASAALPPNLIDGTQGDIAYLTQLATAISGVTTYQALRRLYQPGAFTQTSGATTTLTGTFGAVTQNLSVTFNWKRSLFYAYLMAVNPVAVANGQTITLLAEPGGVALTGSVSAPDLLLVYEPTLVTDVTTTALAYGNGFPVQWAVAGSASATFTMQYALPGTTALVALGTIYYNEDLATFTGGPVQPLISPPQNLLVNGKNAALSQTGVTTVPLIIWSAPALGTADAYHVTVYHLTKSGTSTVQTAAAVFYTQARSITLPPGVLQAGESYYLAVRAIAQPGLDVASQPFVSAVPNGGADTLSGILTP